MLITNRPEADLEELRARVYGDVYGPQDDDWDRARQAWNLAVDQRPAAVVFPLTDADVVAIVDYAREAGLRVAPQGTGHGAAALAPLEHAILVSTARMGGVRIDPAARRARVRAGALWQHVTEPASRHGLAPLAGSSPDVGVVGYVLGGGISWLGRKHGVAADSVVAIELVTADGVHVRTDAEHDPDLFWALRGGGGSFGVVTALEIELHPVTELHAGALAWPWERAEEIFDAWRAWTETVPDEVTSLCRLLQVPPLPDVPPALRGRQLVVVEAAILGGDDVLAPLRALGPELDMVSPMPPAGLIEIHNDPEQPVPGMGDHRLLAAAPPEAIAELVRVAGADSGSPLLSVELRHLGGALGRRRPGHGALGAFDAAYSLFGVGIVTGPEAAAAIEVALSALLDALAPWDAGRGYLNFAEKPQVASRFFDGDTLARLRAVRRQADPERMFLANHPI